jgi:hypothetical protein
MHRIFDPLVWYLADAAMFGYGRCRGCLYNDITSNGRGDGGYYCYGDGNGNGYGYGHFYYGFFDYYDYISTGYGYYATNMPGAPHF